jgi:hypothetical protein
VYPSLSHKYRSTDHPQLQQVIKNIQGQTLVYCEAMDTSIKTAQDGLDFSSDAIELCGHLLDPDTDPNDLQGYIGDMQNKAKRAHEDSSTTWNKFREVRQGLMEVRCLRCRPSVLVISFYVLDHKYNSKRGSRSTRKGRQGILLSTILNGRKYVGILTYIVLLFIIITERDVEVDAAIEELTLAVLNMTELVDNFADWWCKMDTALHHAENDASYLKPGKNKIRVKAMQKKWATIRDDYKQYSKSFRAVLTSSAPVTFVSAWIGSGIQHIQESLH